VYPEYNQSDPLNPRCAEDTTYPATHPAAKLFSERLYLSYMRNYGMSVRIGRYHNIFGPEGAWNDGKEKAPAALCRKVAMSKEGRIEVWGEGKQTRSFLYIDECLEATICAQISDKNIEAKHDQ
jgi:GDP-D-mannose 3',5'-epimerase